MYVALVCVLLLALCCCTPFAPHLCTPFASPLLPCPVPLAPTLRCPCEQEDWWPVLGPPTHSSLPPHHSLMDRGMKGMEDVAGAVAEAELAP